MREIDIRIRFSQVFKGQKNMLTPTTVESVHVGRFIAELSKGGSLIRGATLYGVTVIELPSTRRDDLSRAFHTIADARSFISELEDRND